MTREEFENIVSEGFNDLPQTIRQKMDNVALVIEDYPSSAQMQKGGTKRGMLLLGFYEGVPRTKRGAGYNLVLPDKITIFQKTIEMVARSEEQIKSVVKETVWHEIAHHFGFDEESVRKLSKKRKK